MVKYKFKVDVHAEFVISDDEVSYEPEHVDAVKTALLDAIIDEMGTNPSYRGSKKVYDNGDMIEIKIIE